MLLIYSPLKVGDTLYFMSINEIQSCTINKIEISCMGHNPIEYFYYTDALTFTADDFNRIVFKSPAALKRRLKCLQIQN